MYQRFPRSAPILLFLVTTMMAGCENTAVGPTSVATAGLQPAITAEPLIAQPEFLSSPGCVTRPAFGIRLAILLRGRGNLFLRGLRFQFLDRFGTRTFPEIIPIPSPLTSPSLLPSSSPVPIPGVAPLPATLPSSGILPFFVRFDCGVLPDGTLIIFADGGESDRELETREMRVRVGNP